MPSAAHRAPWLGSGLDPLADAVRPPSTRARRRAAPPVSMLEPVLFSPSLGQRPSHLVAPRSSSAPTQQPRRLRALVAPVMTLVCAQHCARRCQQRNDANAEQLDHYRQLRGEHSPAIYYQWFQGKPSARHGRATAEAPFGSLRFQALFGFKRARAAPPAAPRHAQGVGATSPRLPPQQASHLRESFDRPRERIAPLAAGSGGRTSRAPASHGTEVRR